MVMKSDIILAFVKAPVGSKLLQNKPPKILNTLKHEKHKCTLHLLKIYLTVSGAKLRVGDSGV